LNILKRNIILNSVSEKLNRGKLQN